MSVAMIATPFGDTGGPEIVVQNLADGLLDLGVDITLFAPADWKTKAKRITTLKKSIWNMKNFSKLNQEEIKKLRIKSQEKVINYQDSFSIIHLHSYKYAAAVCKGVKIPCVISFHNNINKEIFCDLKKLRNAYMVSLSESQRGNLNTDATIWNGVPTKKIKYSTKKGKYFIFIGRLTDQKGVDKAIKIAKKAGEKLLIFGRIGKSLERKKFFSEKINPYLDGKNIIYKGEVGHEEIYKYLRNAKALIHLIRRPEVSSMVAMESLACGTPVIGTNIKPLPELLKNKGVAYLSNDPEKIIKKMKNISSFDRRACRKYAEDNFDSSIMAKKYKNLYENILNSLING